MPRKARICSACGKRPAAAGEESCARCIEIQTTPAMMLDRCYVCKTTMLLGECCSCWCCRCGEVNLYGQPCKLCSRVQTVQ